MEQLENIRAYWNARAEGYSAHNMDELEDENRIRWKNPQEKRFGYRKFTPQQFSFRLLRLITRRMGNGTAFHKKHHFFRLKLFQVPPQSHLCDSKFNGSFLNQKFTCLKHIQYFFMTLVHSAISLVDVIN